MHFRELCSTHFSSGCASPGPPVAPPMRPICQNGAEEDICTDKGGWTCWCLLSFPSPLGECILGRAVGPAEALPPSLAMLAGWLWDVPADHHAVQEAGALPPA